MNFESFKRPKNTGTSEIKKTANKAVTLGVAAMMASVASNELHATETSIDAELLNKNAIEYHTTTGDEKISDENLISFADALKDFSINPSIEEEVKPIKKTVEKQAEEITKKVDEKSIEKQGENLRTLESSNYATFFDAGFEMGKADLSPEQQIQIKDDFKKFAESFPSEVLSNPEKFEVVIKAYASKHRIAEMGVDTGKRGKAFTNKELAQFRAEEAKSVWDDIAKEKNLPTNINVRIDTSHDGVYDGNTQKTLQDGRMIEISISVIQEKDTSLENTPSVFEQDLSQLAFVVIDRSPSMRSEARHAQAVVDKYNKQSGGNIQIINLETDRGYVGTVEDHIGTLEKLLSTITESYQEEKIGYVITDEFQNKKYADAELRIENIIAKAKELNIKLVIQKYQEGDTSILETKEVSTQSILGK